jgi:thymidine phosphorylase
MPVPADAEGTIASIDTRALGLAVVGLGGGRTRAEDPIDHSVGVLCLKKRGDAVQAGEAIAQVHAADEAAAGTAAADVLAAYELVDEPPPERSVVLGVITG